MLPDSPLSDPSFSRRSFFGTAGTFAAAFAMAPGGLHRLLAQSRPQPLRFRPVPGGTEDRVVVPEGYRHQIFAPWGTWVDGREAPFRGDASAADQGQQTGMNHDGMAFFPIDARWDPTEGRLMGSSTEGLLAINHEYTDEGRLHPDGTANWQGPDGPEKVRKSKAAHGVSILHIKKDADEWKILDGRRLTAADPFEIRGPAREHPLMRTPGPRSTADERRGTGVDGTVANCAHGVTPWGTYLSCEENFQDYFARTPGRGGALEARFARYEIGAFPGSIPGARSAMGWDAYDERFDADRPEYENHCHRYGWVVEIDPADPQRRPAKRTALGRCRHENAATVLAPDGRAVVYTADDTRFEYIYKFVSRDRAELIGETDSPEEKRRKRDHNWTLLDHGTLYVARFDGDGTGKGTGSWLELDHERKALSGTFGSAAEVAIFARQAGDLVGATKMDRPEWITVDQDPATRKIRHAYVSLTNNDKRGVPGLEGPNPANPRVRNVFGHIIRWQDEGGDPTATTFAWETFVTCGNRNHPVAAQRGDIVDAPGAGPQDYGSPDGLWLDPRGILWVATDVSTDVMDDEDYAALGNNQLMAVDKTSGETRRFLVGPKGAEISGLAMTPDFRNLFINVQHPGVTQATTDPARPLADGTWPFGLRDNRTRSATVIVTHEDGLPIGSGKPAK